MPETTQTPHITINNTRSRLKRLSWALAVIKWAAIAAAALAVAGFAFVKFDTAAAAEITDAYLRPLFGDKLVVAVEQVFFNLSDSANRVIYSYDFKKPVAPQFIRGNPLPDQTGLDLTPIPPNPAFSPLSGEGAWNSIPLSAFPGRTVLAYTFIRPDSSRSFAIVSVVKADTSALTLGSVAGTVEPGGKVGKFGPGRVPREIAQSGRLVAAFDGGFQYRDGAYGMIVGNTTYLPLKPGLGTIVGLADGTVKIVSYTGQDFGKANFIRQNGPMLIEHGSIVVANEDSQKVWGRVIGAQMFTWRSGIGITRHGNLLFAAGNNLNPLTLAQALAAAGATDAIQLDINPHWVRFNVFNYRGGGQYDSYPLNKEMADGAKEYLNGYQKDFFYLYKK